MPASRLFSLTPVTGAACLLVHLIAQGQTTAPGAAAPAPAAAASQPGGVSSLTTVVITTQRATGFTSSVVGIGAFRDQAPVDVPLTNSVITRDALDAQGARSVLDAVRNTAGVTRAQLGSSFYDNLAIRGVTMENRSSYRLDGSLPLVGIIPIPIEDKERVEVLKGASSMYYGMVPPAGVVNFEMKRAGEKPITSVAGSINEYGGYDAHLDIGRRFGENGRFGVRVNLLGAKEDLGIEPYKGRRELAAAALDYRILDNLTVRADLEHYTKKGIEQASVQLIGTALVLPPVPDNKTNAAGDWAQTYGRSDNALVRVDWGISENWSLTAEYGRVRADRDRQFTTFTFTPATGDSPTQPQSYISGNGRVFGNFNFGSYYINENTRLDLLGRIETGPIAHEVTFGYTRNQRDQDIRGNTVQSFGCPTLTTPTSSTCLTGANTRPNLPQNLYSPIPVPLQLQKAPNSALTTSITDTGIYAVDRIILSPRWHVMVGVRRTDYESGQTDPVSAVPFYSASKTTPNVSVIFKPTSSSSIYGSRLSGLEAGTLVGATFSNSGSLLPAATTTQYELGAKMQLAGGTLLQAALFSIQRAQTTVEPAPPGSPPPPNLPTQAPADRTIQTQNGEAEYKGLELAASGELSRNFGVVASAIFMDPLIKKDSTIGSTNRQGKIPGNAAKTTASLFGEYRFDAVPGLGVNAGAYYIGKRPVSDVNLVYLPGVVTYSLGARYRTTIAQTAATFQINVDNASNKDYWAAADSTTANPLVAAGLPRQIRASAKFDF